MTRSQFLSIALARKREADIFVANALGIVHKCVGPKLYREWRWIGAGHDTELLDPWATCPDDAPESWTIFGEMVDKMREMPNEVLAIEWVPVVPNRYYAHGKDWIIRWGEAYEWGRSECAPTRVLAAALALLDARGAFEKEAQK